MTKPVAGFNTRPENINKNGRPPKGYSITDWFKNMLAARPEVREAMGNAIVKKALEGYVAAQKMVWNYMDGLPPQSPNTLIQQNIGEMKMEFGVYDESNPKQVAE